MAIHLVRGSLLLAFGLCDGLRVDFRSAIDERAPAREPVQEETYMGKIRWHKGSKFICVTKFNARKGEHTDQKCLVNLDDVLEANQKLKELREAGRSVEFLRVIEDVMKCQAKDKWSMKVCNLKGEDADIRLSYKTTKQHVPNSCFRKTEEKHANSKGYKFGLVEAALFPLTCQDEMRKSEEAKATWHNVEDVIEPHTSSNAEDAVRNEIQEDSSSGSSDNLPSVESLPSMDKFD